LFVTTRLWTTNSERRIHYHQRAKLVAEARFAAKIQAKVDHLEAPELPVEVVCTPVQPRGVLADPGAHAGVVKAIVDGLRDARVLPDDTGAQIVRVIHLAPRRAKAGEGEGVEITLRTMQSPDAATRAGLDKEGAAG
jgi:hypothetical protein